MMWWSCAQSGQRSGLFCHNHVSFSFCFLVLCSVESVQFYTYNREWRTRTAGNHQTSPEKSFWQRFWIWLADERVMTVRRWQCILVLETWRQNWLYLTGLWESDYSQGCISDWKGLDLTIMSKNRYTEDVQLSFVHRGTRHSEEIIFWRFQWRCY